MTRSYGQRAMPTMSTRLSISDEQWFALLMIALSVVILVAVRRDERG
jgi:hypothetical protein